MDLHQKVALVTGGGSGIGFAIARALSEAGAHTVLASRRIAMLREKSAQLERSDGVRSFAVELNLQSADSIREAMQEVWRKYPRVDILVNNSGVGTGALAVDLNEREWNRVLSVNLTGAFLLTREVLPKMIEQRSGHIINIASQAAKHGYANATAYCASKFGLVGFGQALQEEVRPYNIKVTNLLPALVQVPPPDRAPESRSGVLQVEDLAATVLYILRQPDRVKFEDIGLYHL